MKKIYSFVTCKGFALLSLLLLSCYTFAAVTPGCSITKSNGGSCFSTTLTSVTLNNNNTYTVILTVNNDGSPGPGCKTLSHYSVEATPGTYSNVVVNVVSGTMTYNHTIAMGPNLGVSTPFQGFKVDNTAGIGDGHAGVFTITYTLTALQAQRTDASAGGVDQIASFSLADFQSVLNCQGDTPIHNIFPVTGYASIAFEDLWPAQGDYDMNDIVVDCRFDQISNPQNKITQIQAQFRLRAMGASYHDGFGIELPVTPDKVSSCVVTLDNGQPVPMAGLTTINSKGLEQGQSKAVVILFDDGFNVLPQLYAGIGVNTTLGIPWTEPQNINLTLTFTEPIDPNLLVAPYNPFIFANKNRGCEIHLPNYPPTTLADRSLFNTLDDNSKVSTFNTASVKSYLTAKNLPWALLFYNRYDYPIEKASILEAFLHFGSWAQSGGQLFTDWYFNTATGYRVDSKVYLHEQSSQAATVTTTAISNITTSKATSGGNITNDGGSAITVRGICWGTTANPTIANSITTDGTGTGSFTSNLTGLTSSTNYFVRAYATNGSGTVYGSQQTFSTSSDGISFTLNTLPVTSILATTALARADVTNDGGLPVTSRGVCWSTVMTPTTADSKTVEGSGLGQFTSTLTGLTPNTTYYIRGYATSGSITVYGNELSFKTAVSNPIIFNPNLTYGTVTDVEGNIYKTITIGTQTWMAENLRTTKFNDGTAIPLVTDNTAWANLNTPGYCFYNNNETAYKSTYGALYNWHAVNSGKLAPAGWHVPGDVEWQTLRDFLGGVNVDGGKLKETGTSHWNSPNTDATNESGFTGLSGNNRDLDGKFSTDGNYGYWWMSLSFDATNAWFFSLNNNLAYDYQFHYSKQIGNSVRLIKDAPIALPTLTTDPASNLTATTVTSGGNITSDGGDAITARGTCWSLSENPVITDFKTTEGTGTGVFTSNLTGLTANTSYFVRSYATNAAGTAYGNQQTFTTPQAIMPLLVITMNVVNITSTSATTSGHISSDGGFAVTARGVCWSTNTNPTIADAKTSDGTGMGDYTCNMTGLTPNTTYYIRTYAINSTKTAYGNQVTFTTLQTAPTVTTSAITNITATTASAGGTVTSDGGASITARGICWSTTENPTITNSKTTDGTGVGAFTSNLTGLTANTSYFMRSYATNAIGTAYGDQQMFITLQTVPTVTTSAISSITSTTVSTGGNATADGGATITARGICWSTTENPTITNSKTTDGTGVGAFTSNISGLTINTLYYIRAYATNSAGTTYGAQQSFTTLQSTPTVTTTSITNITATSVSTGGTATSDGGMAVTSRGVCWSTNENPTITNARTIDGTGVGVFTSNIYGLTVNTLYYIRAYATNGLGTTYGAQESFTTLQSAPSLTTTLVSNITPSSASTGGNITSDGTAAVTARGVCWNTTGDPTIADPKTTDGAGTGAFTSNITGLTGSTLYYYRSYATNSIGTEYGAQLAFTTLHDITIPSVVTLSINSITTTTAATSGVITDNGGTPVISRGVCWSTSENPTISDSKTIDGSGDGSFKSNLTGLVFNTTYYVRAYATNSIGTAYGQPQVFTSQNISIPILSTALVTNITSTTADCGGNAYSDGNATITARGICWSTSENPTIADPKTIDGSGLGAYTSTLTGLIPNTTYYTRAYGTNNIGTNYGPQRTFKTGPTTPSVVTTDVTAITISSAIVGGNVTSDGGIGSVSRGICWSTTENPTIANFKTSSGAGYGAGTFTCSLTGLTPNTIYYACAFATNSLGTTYGPQKTFTTLHTIPSLTTNTISNITSLTATSGGNVTNDSGSPITARGICWSAGSIPTISNSKTVDGSGLGTFTSNITGLSEDTYYHVRAYATNSIGTAYGAELIFKSAPRAVLLLSTTNVTLTTVSFTGIVNYDSGSPVTARGICWSEYSNPANATSRTIDGSGIGNFSSNLTGLKPNTLYYCWAYATNALGTVYSNQSSFKTLNNGPIIFNPNLSYGSLSDVDGNVYKTITIGSQTWMAENLKTTKYNDGTAIPLVTDKATWSNLSSPAYTWVGADAETRKVYGAYYNWYVVNTKKVAPSGWHVPSDAEWSLLDSFLGGYYRTSGGKMKETGTTHWSSPNAAATNESGFTALPSGSFLGSTPGIFGDWWSSTEESTNAAWDCCIYYPNGTLSMRSLDGKKSYKSDGNSIRCVKDNIPYLTTSSVNGITTTSALGGGIITIDAGSDVTARGVCWSTSSNPTTSDNKTTDGTGIGTFSSNISGLIANTTYYVRAYATNSLGTAYGSQQSFKTPQ